MRPSWSFVDGVLNFKKKTKIADEIAYFILLLTQLSPLKLFSVIFRGIFLLVDLLKR